MGLGQVSLGQRREDGKGPPTQVAFPCLSPQTSEVKFPGVLQPYLIPPSTGYSPLL